MGPAVLGLTTLAVAALGVPCTGAQCPITHVQKFGAPDPSTNRWFGDAIALDGDVVFIGSSFDDYLCPEDPLCDAGSVQVLVFAGGVWAPTQRLTPYQPQEGEGFGNSIALEGDRALIGAYGNDTPYFKSGCVYDFRFDGEQWVEHRVLRASDPTSMAWFGWDVAMEDSVAVVGAQGAGTDGAVYIFRLTDDEWVQEQRLSPDDLTAMACFGYSVAIAAGRIFVGANRDADMGSVYIYERDGQSWEVRQELTPPAGIAGDRFGESVAILNDFAVVGASEEDGGAACSGAAHVYWFDGQDWLHTHRLVPSDPRAGAWFGGAVALGGNLAVIGASSHSEMGEDAGQAYAFTFDGMHWTEAAPLRPAEVDEYDMFGFAVAIDGVEALIGAVRDDDPCGGGICGAGAVYVFRPLGNCDASSGIDLCEIQGGQVEDCNANLVPDLCDIASGASDDCNVNGVPDECEPYTPPAGEQKALAPVPATMDMFGSTVAVLDDVAVVGAPRRDSQGVDAGAAYVLRRVGGVWAHEAMLVGDDLTPYDYFGCAVAAERGVVFAGAYDVITGGTQCGAVYVYRHDGAAWAQEAKIIPLDAQTNMRFGWSVGGCGDLLIVGAPQEGPVEFGMRGAAYVFRHNGAAWVQEAKLLAPVFATGDYFGCSVAIDGDVAVVGEYYDDDVAVNAGAAHVFRFDGEAWVHEAKLTNPVGARWDYFGSSVAVSGDLVAIGAIRGTVDGLAVGAVYVYRYDGQAWAQEDVLIANAPQVQMWLGCSTSIVGSTVLAGAYEADVGPVRSGAAYLFQHDGAHWTQRAKLWPSDGEFLDWFGYAVAFDGRGLSIGAPREDEGISDGGACYFYDVPVGPPLITRQPSSLWVEVGARASFVVTAVGAAPLSYRWQKDGQDLSDGGGISGATTARLVIAQAGLTDIGRYRCVVTGACGETTSREARLWMDEAAAVSDALPSPKLTVARSCPNPFHASARIEFNPPSRGRVTVRIYSLCGELVTTLLDGEVAPGPNVVIWNGTDACGARAGSGVYLCRVTGFGQKVSRMLTVVR
jgi:hypothetical protein